MKDIADAGPNAAEATLAGTDAETDTDADVRARPGRRSVEERQQAVLELLGGKATVDQVARRLGVLASTVEDWREDALGGIAEALRRVERAKRPTGPARSKR
jgi:transposase-like protein